MSVTVILSSTLRTFAEHRNELKLDGATVREVVSSLADEYPEINRALFDEDKTPRSFVNIFLEDTNIRDLDGFDTEVFDGDSLYFIPAIAGGSGEIEKKEKIKLTDDEITRYSKHLLLRDIGIKGQKKIKAAKVLIVGLGALGAPLAQYLAAAGVGKIGLVDFDEVDKTNLQSQVIHGTRDVGRPKVASARDSIRAINPQVQVEMYHEKLTVENAVDIISEYDVVADATDNYKARYLVNDACVLAGRPEVFGAMYQFEGQVSVFDAQEGPCYRCMFPAPPPTGLVPTCAEGGVVSSLPGVVGSMQATEVLKLIIGTGKPLIGEILSIDTWNAGFHLLKLKKNPDCPICGKHPTILEVEDFDYEDFCGLKEEEFEIPVEGIEPEELAARIDNGEPLTIVDVREPHERAIIRFPNAIVIPIGQLARRQKELDPDIDTVFICREGKRSILAINTLREAGYQGPMYNLKGGMEAARQIIFSHEGAWL